MAYVHKPTADCKIVTPRGMTPVDRLTSPEYLINHIEDALQAKIDQINQLIQSDNRNIIMARYELGLLVQEIYDDTTDQGGDRRYGDKAMQKLCIAIPWCRSLLYETLLLVQHMSREEAERLSTLHTKSGQPIFWTHVRILSGVTNPKSRNELLEHTLQEDWTCEELGKAVMQLKEPNETVGARKAKGPRNLNGMIEQQQAYADHFLERAERVWNNPEQSLTNLCLDMPAEKYTQEGANKLKGLAGRLRLVAQEAEKRAQEAEKAFKEYLNILVAAKIEAAEMEEQPEEEVELEEELDDEEELVAQLVA